MQLCSNIKSSPCSAMLSRSNGKVDLILKRAKAHGISQYQSLQSKLDWVSLRFLGQ